MVAVEQTIRNTPGLQTQQAQESSPSVASSTGKWGFRSVTPLALTVVAVVALAALATPAAAQMYGGGECGYNTWGQHVCCGYDSWGDYICQATQEQICQMMEKCSLQYFGWFSGWQQVCQQVEVCNPVSSIFNLF